MVNFCKWQQANRQENIFSVLSLENINDSYFRCWSTETFFPSWLDKPTEQKRFDRKLSKFIIADERFEINWKHFTLNVLFLFVFLTIDKRHDEYDPFYMFHLNSFSGVFDSLIHKNVVLHSTTLPHLSCLLKYKQSLKCS